MTVRRMPVWKSLKASAICIRWKTGPNRGGNTARNRLLELARGEWLQYLDADDYLLPAKIERQMFFLAQHPGTDIVFGPVIWEHWKAGQARREIAPIVEPHDPWILLARWRLPQTGSPLWRKEVVITAGGWKINQPCCQEHELYLRLLISGARFSYYGDAGVVYRQWSDTTVCRRNVPEVRRRRLEVKQREEDYLRRTNQLTVARQYAINQARFELARLIWRYDRESACATMQQICGLDSHFMPAGPAAPWYYRLVYRLFGFQVAERFAEVKRSLFRPTTTS